MNDIEWQPAAIVGGVLIVIFAFWLWWRHGAPESPQSPPNRKTLFICAHCGNYGYAQKSVPGSTFVAIVLLIFFVVPGVFYLLWRQIGTKYICPSCASTKLVPLNSPRGAKLQSDFHGNQN